MKGTLGDFLAFAAQDEQVARELVELAGRRGFEFVETSRDGDALPDEALDTAAGGVTTADFKSALSSLSAGLALVAATHDVALTSGGGSTMTGSSADSFTQGSSTIPTGSSEPTPTSSPKLPT